eukprot:gene7405-biopygen19553
MPVCTRIPRAPDSLGMAGPEVDHRNPIHEANVAAPAPPPQAPGLRLPGVLAQDRWGGGVPHVLAGFDIKCKQSNHNFKPSSGCAKRRKRSRKTLVGKRSPGALHRHFPAFRKSTERCPYN